MLAGGAHCENHMPSSSMSSKSCRPVKSYKITKCVKASHAAGANEMPTPDWPARPGTTCSAQTVRGLGDLDHLDVWDRNDFLNELQLWERDCLTTCP